MFGAREDSIEHQEINLFTFIIFCALQMFLGGSWTHGNKFAVI